MADVVCLQEVQETVLDSFHKTFGEVYSFTSLSPNNPTSANVPNGTMIMIKKSFCDTWSYENIVWTKEGSAGTVLKAQIIVSDTKREIKFVSCHFASGNKGSVQLQRAVQLCEQQNSQATIICGDFNMTNTRPAYQDTMSKSYKDAFANKNEPTYYPAKAEARRYDQMLYNGVVVVSTEDLPWIPICQKAQNAPEACSTCLSHCGSDHTPICATFGW